MTDARLGGLAREALVADSGQVTLGGIVREALVAGVGLTATVAARSSGRSNASVLFAGVILHATGNARSHMRSAPMRFHIDVGGRVRSRSSIRAGWRTSVVLAGRVSAKSGGHLVRVGPVVLGGKAAAQSGGNASAITAPTVRTRQYAVSIIG
jgi:hypothetical protein